MDFKKITEHVVFDEFRRIIKRVVETPSGKRLDFMINDARDGTTIFALTETKQIIVTQQFRVGPFRPLWGLPAGFVNLNEDPMTAATRELLEETGYSPKEGVYLLGSAYDDAYSTGRKNFYFAPLCVRTHQPKIDPEEEGLTMSFVTAEELRELILAGEMTQTDALCAMLGLDALTRSGVRA